MAWTTATTLAVLSLTSAAVGTGVAVYGQQQNAEAQEATAKYNNRLAENEARNRELEAAEAIKRERRAKHREMARLRNQLAGRGTLTTSGTPLAILGEASANMELRIQDAARASNMQAASLRSQGRMGLWEASQSRTAANLSSAGTALQGLSAGAGSYYDFQRQGAFTRTKRTA